MLCDQQREKDGGEKYNSHHVPAVCCLTVSDVTVRQVPAALYVLSFLGCMSETHANYDGTSVRQLKVHATSLRVVLECGVVPDSTMQRTRRNREAERGEIKHMQLILD